MAVSDFGDLLLGHPGQARDCFEKGFFGFELPPRGCHCDPGFLFGLLLAADFEGGEVRIEVDQRVIDDVVLVLGITSFLRTVGRRRYRNAGGARRPSGSF